MAQTIYQPRYANSRALVIGVNAYSKSSPLGYARQDAEAVAEVLTGSLGFPPENVQVLLDELATREGILSSFFRLTDDSVTQDDRIVFFFAGHGHTYRGNRREIGFLVPVDGDPHNLSTLIRWDELTRNAELVPAKHLLFVMDACYGGLAVQRNLPPGSARFLSDMLQRYSRQVLTAGKGDEAVADSGGPRPGHSIFTGHLLDALSGGATDQNGVLSANAVMAYVYDRVSKDHNSRQSPHFGFMEGDGDFIFAAPDLFHSSQKETQDGDLLVQVPASPYGDLSDARALVEQTKDYLSDPRYRIRLDDLISTEIRAAAYGLRKEEFPLEAPNPTTDNIPARLRKYESSISRLTSVAVLLARWGTAEHQPLIERVVARLGENIQPAGGISSWVALRWYPMLVLMYSAGIAALSTRNYASLSSLLLTPLGNSVSGRDQREAIFEPVDAMLELDRVDFFKAVPGHEKNYLPRSEYLFNAIQPNLDDLLYLGSSYEQLFDTFEVMFALVYAELDVSRDGYVWGPPGRFRWKGRHGVGKSPLDAFVGQALQQGATWPPLAAGFFRGSSERFRKIAEAYIAELRRSPMLY